MAPPSRRFPPTRSRQAWSAGASMVATLLVAWPAEHAPAASAPTTAIAATSRPIDRGVGPPAGRLRGAVLAFLRTPPSRSRPNTEAEAWLSLRAGCRHARIQPPD